MSDFGTANFFTDGSIHDDPYPYFDYLRREAPIWQEPHYGVYMVTGYDEALAIYNDAANFSSCNTVAGPFTKFSVPVEGDDISALIEAHRDELPFSDQLPSFDPPKHTAHRGLLMRLLTPGRLRENEEFMWAFSERQVEEFLAKGECEFVSEYAQPFTLMVIAELEGVPEEDYSQFRARLASIPGSKIELSHKPLEFLYEQFAAYVEDRRAHPQGDILTAMAMATFPDGSMPSVEDVALIAANLFTAGQETTVRLLAFALRVIGERPDVQQALRADRSLIPNFIEEVLRYESPLRGQFRMAKRPMTVAGTALPPGASTLLMPGAANRDPRMFPEPNTFDVARDNARAHLAFGHGIHFCAGAHLARAEGRVTINRLLDMTSDITVSDAAHGPGGARRYEYLPTYLLRGLKSLHLEFTAA
ncbi:MAG TPA: cytochrome P450 [Acidimicrobiales bacterium]|nr:cytochrome P450 [Acidimicrobiales bacterium]